MLDQLTQEEAMALLAGVLALIAAVFAVLTAVAIAFGRRALKHLSELTGIRLSEQHSKTLDGVITGGIAYAQEQTNKLARGLIKSGPTTSEQKLQAAIDYAREHAPEQTAPLDGDTLGQLVEAKLQSIRPTDSVPDESGPRLPIAGPRATPRISIPPYAAPPVISSTPTPVPPARKK